MSIQGYAIHISLKVNNIVDMLISAWIVALPYIRLKGSPHTSLTINKESILSLFQVKRISSSMYIICTWRPYGVKFV